MVETNLNDRLSLLNQEVATGYGAANTKNLQSLDSKTQVIRSLKRGNSTVVEVVDIGSLNRYN